MHGINTNARTRRAFDLGSDRRGPTPTRVENRSGTLALAFMYYHSSVPSPCWVNRITRLEVRDHENGRKRGWLNKRLLRLLTGMFTRAARNESPKRGPLSWSEESRLPTLCVAARLHLSAMQHQYFSAPD